MDNLNSNYIIGLTDGEGSFTIYVKNPESKKLVERRTRVEPKFFLKLIDKDKAILFQFKKFFGCGNVYFQKDKRPNHQNCYRFEVSNRNDLNKVIIPFFQKHPLKLRSKAYDFVVFCRIMKMINRGIHLKDEGLQKIYTLKQKMH